MMTIELAINYSNIHVITAINTGSTDDDKVFEYEVFLGFNRTQAKDIRKIHHIRAEGASVLAIKMLQQFPSP